MCQYTVVEEDYAAISSVLTSHRHGDVATRLNIAEASRLVIVTDCRVLVPGQYRSVRSVIVRDYAPG